MLAIYSEENDKNLHKKIKKKLKKFARDCKHNLYNYVRKWDEI